MKKYWPLAVLLVVGLAALALLNPGSGGGGRAGAPVTLPSGLQYEDLKVGSGAEAKTGDEVEVHYTGRLAEDGEEFESTIGGKPYLFKLGAGRVIKGWDEGVVGMKEGGKRKLMIPAKLAYGSSGAGDKIPPNADLEFEVELVKVVP